MTDSSNWEAEVRRTEALYRFGAALEPRDDFERNLYREWHARDASRAPRTTYGRSPHLGGLTDSQRRRLAEADVQAQAEYFAKLDESTAKPPPQPQLEVEPELEAGF
jgi:hypothetical protein